MKNFLDLGNWNALCDSCGRKFKASQLRRRWDGMMVCSEDYELRHPQDFLRVQKERISVPWARPYPATDTQVITDALQTEVTGPTDRDYILIETGQPIYFES